MPCEQIAISTRDGGCPTRVFTPGADRSCPAIIFYMDAGGIRPAVLGMAERLSQGGYVVLLPDLFYRYAPTVRSIPSCSRAMLERSSDR
jgi:carboxymethylenebutenolidase